MRRDRRVVVVCRSAGFELSSFGQLVYHYNHLQCVNGIVLPLLLYMCLRWALLDDQIVLPCGCRPFSVHLTQALFCNCLRPLLPRPAFEHLALLPLSPKLCADTLHRLLGGPIVLDRLKPSWPPGINKYTWKSLSKAGKPENGDCRS